MKKILIALSISLISASALAGPGLDQLTRFSQQLKTLDAQFVQTTFDESMQEREKSVGQVYMQKPGKFRWNYQQPYEQQIVSDGKKLYIYDVDLDQVTVRDFNDALGTAPISLLTDIADLKQQFNIIELGNIEGRELLQLEAKVKDTDYHYFLLALGEQGLETMELKDKLGQVTRIQLSQTKTNQSLATGLFQFKAPEGVDVIDATQNRDQ